MVRSHEDQRVGVLADQPRGTLRDLKGLGKQIWDGQNAQKYIDRLRDE
jgi:hypothetical protein